MGLIFGQFVPCIKEMTRVNFVHYDGMAPHFLFKALKLYGKIESQGRNATIYEAYVPLYFQCVKTTLKSMKLYFMSGPYLVYRKLQH